MDKNIGEQLNRAYEAFRQACMDRDSAIRELQQKVCALDLKADYISGQWRLRIENIILLQNIWRTIIIKTQECNNK